MRDAAAETLPWEAQAGADDAAYRAQIALSLRALALLPRQARGGGLSRCGGGRRARRDRGAALHREGRAPRQPRRSAHPIGAQLAAPMADVVRIYSTSGTTGSPSYIPLTPADLAAWIEISSRSYAASGVGAGQRIVSTYGAGPFVAAVALDAFAALGLLHIPVGPGNTEKLLAAVDAAGARRYRADAVLCAAPRGIGRGARHRSRRVQRRPAARRGRAGRRRAGAARAAGGGLGREGHRGDGDRRHRGLALGRVRGAGGDAFLRARLRACRADRSGDRRARPFDRRRRGRAGLYPSAAPGGAAAALPQPRSCPGACRRLRLRPDRAAGALHRPDRRHADRARRERLSERGARGGGGLRAGGQRRHRDPAAPARRQAGAAAAGGGRAGAGPGGRGRSSPRRSAGGCARR